MSEREPIPEQEKYPHYRFMITRHAERLPSGELSPEGIEHAKRKGVIMAQAEVLKAYASDHKSGRAVMTGDLISKESGVTSPVTGEQYATRQVEDIQYDVLKPDLYHVIPELKLLIEKPTLEEAYQDEELKGLIEAEIRSNSSIMKKNSDGNPMVDIEKLSTDVQKRIAPIRQKYQRVAFDEVFAKQPETVHRMAFGLAHQLVHEMDIAHRYANQRGRVNKKPQKDVILNTATHGLFIESLLREAGLVHRDDGNVTLGVMDFDIEIAGYIQPAESVYLDIKDMNNIPENIPIVFEGQHRPHPGKIFIRRSRLEELNQDYKKWKKSFLK